MPYTLTYNISPPFIGTRGTVAQAQPSSLSIDSSSYKSGENRISPNGPTGISVAKLGSGVTLNIRMQDSAGNTYYPVGLAIQPQGGSQRTPTGVFPTANVSSADPTTIVLVDMAQDPGAPGSYEFVVLFQMPNGNFGWLDPMVVNDGT